MIVAVRFDPKILTMLATKGQGLHRVGSDWKVPDWNIARLKYVPN